MSSDSLGISQTKSNLQEAEAAALARATAAGLFDENSSGKPRPSKARNAGERKQNNIALSPLSANSGIVHTIAVRTQEGKELTFTPQVVDHGQYVPPDPNSVLAKSGNNNNASSNVDDSQSSQPSSARNSVSGQPANDNDNDNDNDSGSDLGIGSNDRGSSLLLEIV